MVQRSNAPLPSSARHPKSQRFHEILHELGELHDLKSRDYGNQDDPFSNITASQEWGIPPTLGALLRLNDKVNRLKTWQRTGSLANESARDSLRDIAVYAIIALVLDESAEAAFNQEMSNSVNEMTKSVKQLD